MKNGSLLKPWPNVDVVTIIISVRPPSAMQQAHYYSNVGIVVK